MLSLQYLSSHVVGSGVSTTAWLRCSGGIGLDWFCHVINFSVLPAKKTKQFFKIYGERNQCKVQNMYSFCLNYIKKVAYVNWFLSRENMSSGCSIKRVSNQSSQLLFICDLSVLTFGRVHVPGLSR